MADFAYAVHTDVCTYLLDDSGVCLWVLSPNPATARIVEACVGAQFVACSDTRVPGGLVGELVQGAGALFVTVSKETGRPILLRTGPIRRVQVRHAGDNLPPGPRLEVIADEDLIDPPTVTKPTLPKPRKKGDSVLPPPPVPRPSRRKLDPDEVSITLVTYPSGPLIPKPSDDAAPKSQRPSRIPGEDAAPMPLRTKRKKT
ncbi:MAG: hypothetical protein HY898_00715 [Deltaproteobacteria bacterium]|nr:hypothetical protein [Deltaproteobacteria bacterium]